MKALNEEQILQAAVAWINDVLPEGAAGQTVQQVFEALPKNTPVWMGLVAAFKAGMEHQKETM